MANSDNKNIVEEPKILNNNPEVRGVADRKSVV